MKRIWTIARRELRALFDHPTGYILLIVFIAVNNFLFFRQAYVAGVATIRPMLELMPWLLLFLVPAVTMRALAEDARTGTLEVVLAQPISEWEFLIGKYLGAVFFLWIALGLTLLVPVGLSLGADMPAGVVVAQYVGAALLAAGMAGVGIWASSLTRNQITAFIIGVGVMFVLILVGLDPLLVGLPPTLGTIAARLGVLSHFTNISRGLIDLRDVIYFLSLAAVFVMLAYGTLQGGRLSAGGAARRRLRVGVLVLVAVAVVLNLLGSYIGGRLDLTPGKAYTLSRTTKNLVANLDDFVTLKLFASTELPPQVALVKRDIDDLLRDLKSASRGNVRVVERNTTDDRDARSEARSIGIPAVQFNVVGESQLQIQEGYMGLAIEYAGETEIIPFVRRSDDLEYRLASGIRSLTQAGDRPVLGLMAGALGPAEQRSFQALQQELSKAYEVRPLVLPAAGEPGDDIDALILAGYPDSLPADQVERLKAFFKGGGSALLMASGTMIDPTQQMVANSREILWNRVIDDFGVAIRPDMVYDLLSNEPVSLPTQFGRILTPYPFWIRAASTGASLVNEQTQALFLPWTSSIDTSGAAPGTVTPLYVTSRAAGIQTEQILLIPQQQFPQANLTTLLVAAMVQPALAEGEASQAAPAGRLVVVGNSDFVADAQLRSAPENLTFALNVVDWLAEDESLIAIRSKDRSPPPLVLEEGKRDAVKYANLVGVPVVIILAALLRLLRRKHMTRRVYQPADAARAAS